MSRKALLLYGIFFALGLIEGTVTYIQSRGNTPPAFLHTDATANAVHICLAVLLVISGIVGYLVCKRKGFAYSRIWEAPFSKAHWNRQLFGALGLPFALVEIICALLGAKATAKRIETWRLRRFLGVTNPSHLHGGYFALGLLFGAATSVIVVLMWFLFWRAGLQVVGALDPSFRDYAWGGPTYLGASGAHWLDALIMIYAGTFIVRWLVTRQQRLAA